MERFDRWLGARPLVLTLLLALVPVACLYAAGIFSESVMPFGDGEHYVLRAFALYGYLHAGEWAKFWDLLTLPRQSIVQPHYPFFFLLPQAWAGITSYGLTQAITTYVLLAWGVWVLCRALDRPGWTPALFILCAVQNVSLDYSYFYFVDVSFFAVGILALGWQVRAWQQASVLSSVWSGVGLGLLFWIKPANSAIFAGIYVLAEAIRFVLLAWKATPGLWKLILRHVVAVSLGFLPLVLTAMACGGSQVILHVVDADEASGVFVTRLECTGLVRLLYFPLCLSYYYHVGLILILAAVVWLVSQFRQGAAVAVPPETAFPILRFIPLLAASFIFGEVFSFLMTFKTMRVLMLILPVFWLAIFWLVERWKVRPALVFFAAAGYAVLGYSQIFFNTFGTRGANTESYQLTDDWLERLPAPQGVYVSGANLSQSLVSVIRQNLPGGGKVAVGTEQLYLTSESLTWVLQHNQKLVNREAPYQFSNFINPEGKISRSNLLGARAILLILHPSFQYSPQVAKTSQDLTEFALLTWERAEHGAKVIALQAGSGQSLGCLVVLNAPLTDQQITQALDATKAVELPRINEFNILNDRRLSVHESWEIIRKLIRKRFGG